jgi:hypothetical protein
LSHYKFQRLLDHKMKIRQGKLHICTEEYTTMTCGQCGRLNRNVGSNSTYKCPYEGCGYVAGRDTNAARNIFIMNHKLVSTKYIEWCIFSYTSFNIFRGHLSLSLQGNGDRVFRLSLCWCSLRVFLSVSTVLYTSISYKVFLTWLIYVRIEAQYYSQFWFIY